MPTLPGYSTWDALPLLLGDCHSAHENDGAEAEAIKYGASMIAHLSRELSRGAHRERAQRRVPRTSVRQTRLCAVLVHEAMCDG